MTVLEEHEEEIGNLLQQYGILLEYERMQEMVSVSCVPPVSVRLAQHSEYLNCAAFLIQNEPRSAIKQ